MDIKFLHTFRTIFVEGSFTKAAEKLHYTPSTITFQMGQLEKQLQVTLFEKAGRTMVPTLAAKLLLPHAEEVLASVERLQDFHQALDAGRGELRVGLAESQLCYRLPPLFQTFQRMAPQASLSLRSMNCYDIRDELLSGTLDVGVFYEDIGGYGSRIVTWPMGTFPLVLVASPETAAAHPDFITPDRLLPLPFLINEPQCVYRQIFERYLGERALSVGRTIELWSLPTILHLVKNNLGFTFLPRFAVEKELERGELTEIPTAMETPCIHAVCGHSEHKWISPLLRTFLDLCQKSCSQTYLTD